MSCGKVGGEHPPADPAPHEPEPPIAAGFHVVEDLDRGVVAVVQPDGVYVGWRMLGYEYDRESPERVSYHLYRDGEFLANVSGSTNFLDPSGDAASVYRVSPVTDEIEGGASAPVAPWNAPFLRVPLERPAAATAAELS